MQPPPASSLLTFGAGAAALAAVSFTAGSLVLDLPNHDDVDALVNDFYGSSSGRWRVVAGGYLLAISGLSLLAAFVVLAYTVLTGVGRTLCISFATIGATLVLAAAGTQGVTYALSIEAFDEAETELNRFIPHLAYGMLLFAFLALAASLVTLAAANRRSGETRAMPRALARAAHATAACLCLAIFFLPMVALPLWLLGAAAWLARCAASARAR